MVTLTSVLIYIRYLDFFNGKFYVLISPHCIFSRFATFSAPDCSRMSGEGRPLFRIIWRNFINSLKPRQIQGDKIGKDYLGNSYFEISSQKRDGRRASRWFEPAEKDDFESEVPSEWQSWLRHRRKQPPTEEEISQNLAVSNMKKVNAARLEAERLAAGGAPPPVPETGPGSFPAYDEYELGGKPVSMRTDQGHKKLFPEFPTPGKGELK